MMTIDNDTDNDIDAQWLAMLSYLYIQQKHYAKAIVLLEAWLLLRPGDIQSLKALAVSYLHNRQQREALAATEQLLKKMRHMPDDLLAPVWLIRARAFALAGEAGPAREALRHYHEWRRP